MNIRFEENFENIKFDNVYFLKNEIYFTELFDLVKNNIKSYPNFLRFSKKYLMNWINEETSFLNQYGQFKLKTKIFYILNGYTEIVKCITCKKPMLKDVVTIYDGYGEHGCKFPHCSYECTKNDINRTMKYKETCLKKYGVDVFVKSKIQKEKSKETKKRNYR